MLIDASRFSIIFTLVSALTFEVASAQQTRRPLVVKALRPHEFALFPWDVMRLIDGPEDKVHGLASLAECNFTFAGFPPVADLDACEKLGLKAIVYPDPSLGLT